MPPPGPRDAIRAHLEYFGELGVDGVRLDSEWRARADRGVGLQADSTRSGADSNPAEGDSNPAEAGLYVPVTEVDPLKALRIDLGPDCSRCKLHTLGRKQVVFGVGNPNADLMFVGEAPGADEDIQGEPFVGRAGQLLTKIIEAIDLKREDVYIANVIKCRPPGNRNPEPDEVEQCEPFLFRQIDIIKPRVIVALGKFAAQCLLKTDAPITRIRGREFTYRDAVLIPTYHPAYLLRNPSAKRDVWEDMKKVRAILSQSADE
ncbi:MAG TPA: uracil-DNA glycosylase [Vicinamibacterales bacterium]|nr:uracil-DNA glycosylase [Vicinamibacterales bacterium]